jgi:hypothetical protein
MHFLCLHLHVFVSSFADGYMPFSPGQIIVLIVTTYVPAGPVV